MEYLLTPTPVGAMALVAFCGVAIVGTVWIAASLVARTLPAKVRQLVEDLDERVHDAERDAQRLRVEWAESQTALEALLASIEKKRKQAAASASRAAALQAEQEAEHVPMGEEDALASARRNFGLL